MPGDTKLVRRLVRQQLSRGLVPPFPVHVLSDICRVTGETPWAVDLMSKIEYENQRKYTWQPWEVAYLKAHFHLPDKVLAKVLGRSVESVRGKRIALKLHRPRGRRAAVESSARLT